MCNIRSSSAKSSYASTTSSGALTSEGGISSADFSPKSLEKHCRPINVVVMETEVKGSLIERLVHVENRLLQLCLQMEEEIVAEKKRVEVEESRSPNHKKKRKGLKQLVKSCVGGQPKMKDSKTDD
ncbi:uncharacterized protein LOC122642943 isoform X1 [Telopea speciosissima]|uniref:uncharacterized protein LOC122642943 isoform X1 n=1 Tax=Telopea speciosissima TaxID=54955 RepID=UPI001CC4773F|nr:uncharacterized protein LOC122642943 isoform X1 [Telopea speciosissima]